MGRGGISCPPGGFSLCRESIPPGAGDSWGVKNPFGRGGGRTRFHFSGGPGGMGGWSTPGPVSLAGEVFPLEFSSRWTGGPVGFYAAGVFAFQRNFAQKLLGPEEVAGPAAWPGLAVRRHFCCWSRTRTFAGCTTRGKRAAQRFLVCELLDGRALDEVVAAEGALPLDRVVVLGSRSAMRSPPPIAAASCTPT